MMRKDEFRFALVIPKDVVRTDRIGIHLKAYSNPRNDIEAQTVNGILQKTLFSKAPELLGKSLQARARSYLGASGLERFHTSISSAVSEAFGGDASTIKAHLQDGEFGFRRLDGGSSGPADEAGPTDVFSRDRVTLDNIQVSGSDVKSPMATLLVGGWAMQFLLFAVTSSGQLALPGEGARDLPARAVRAARPGATSSWSKFLYGVTLGLLQLVVPLPRRPPPLRDRGIGPYFGRLVVVCVFAAAACTSPSACSSRPSPRPRSRPAGSRPSSSCSCAPSAVRGFR